MAELDGIILHLAKMELKGAEVGLISEEGVDWGGEKPQFVEVVAAQTRSVVKKVLKKAGTNVMSFKLIELKVANLMQLLGGSADSGTPEKWLAPLTPVLIEGALKLTTVTGQVVEAAKVSLSGEVRGTIGGDDPLYVECEMTVLNDGETSPFSITNLKPST